MLLDTPNEIINHVISLLDLISLSRICKVSKFLFDTYEPILRFAKLKLLEKYKKEYESELYIDHVKSIFIVNQVLNGEEPIIPNMKTGTIRRTKIINETDYESVNILIRNLRYREKALIEKKQYRLHNKVFQDFLSKLS